MTKVITRDITKLPRWAQDYIRTLKADLQDHKDAAAERGTSPVCCNPYRQPPTYLPDGQKVRFVVASPRPEWTDEHPDDAAESRFYIDVRRSEGGIELMGAYPLTIDPSVSNVIHVKLRPRFT